MRFYITNIVKVFYLLDFMRAMIYNPQLDFIKSIERLREDLNKVYLPYAKHLANALYDYIIYATFDELLNAPAKCDISITEAFGYSVWDVGAYLTKNLISQLYIPNYLDTAEHIYKKGDWAYAYGGEKWAKAIEYAKLRPKMNDVLFIDSVVDLQHNTGSLFSKSNPYFRCASKDIIGFLDIKTSIERDNELFSYLENHAIDYLNKEMRSLLFRFIQLYSGRFWSEQDVLGYYDSHSEHSYTFLCGRVYPTFEMEIKTLMEYEPIKYSGIPVTYQISNSKDLQINKFGYSFSDEERRTEHKIAEERLGISRRQINKAVADDMVDEVTKEAV